MSISSNRKSVNMVFLWLAAALLLFAACGRLARAAETKETEEIAAEGKVRYIVPKKVKKIGDSMADAGEESYSGEGEEFRPKIYEDHREEMESRKEYIAGMIYFNQKDEVWNENGYCVARSGCGPTSMAVVISSLTGKWVTPLDTIEWAYKHGYYSGDGSVHEAIPALARAYGLTCQGLGKDYKKIRSALRKGHPVVCLMGEGYFTAGGHFMVLVDIDDKNCVTVADVGSRKRSSYKYRLKQVISQAKSASAGGPFWVMGYERMSGLAEGRTLRDYMETDPGEAFDTSFLADARDGLAEFTAESLAVKELSRRFVSVSEPLTGGILKTDISDRSTGQIFVAMTVRKSWVPVTGLMTESASVEDYLTSSVSGLRLE